VISLSEKSLTPIHPLGKTCGILGDFFMIPVDLVYTISINILYTNQKCPSFILIEFFIKTFKRIIKI